MIWICSISHWNGAITQRKTKKNYRFARKTGRSFGDGTIFSTFSTLPPKSKKEKGTTATLDELTGKCVPVIYVWRRDEIEKGYVVKDINPALIFDQKKSAPMLRKNDEYDAHAVATVLINQLHTLPVVKPRDNHWTLSQLVFSDWARLNLIWNVSGQTEILPVSFRTPEILSREAGCLIWSIRKSPWFNWTRRLRRYY